MNINISVPHNKYRVQVVPDVIMFCRYVYSFGMEDIYISTGLHAPYFRWRAAKRTRGAAHRVAGFSRRRRRKRRRRRRRKRSVGQILPPSFPKHKAVSCKRSCQFLISIINFFMSNSTSMFPLWTLQLAVLITWRKLLRYVNAHIG